MGFLAHFRNDVLLLIHFVLVVGYLPILRFDLITQSNHLLLKLGDFVHQLVLPTQFELQVGYFLAVSYYLLLLGWLQLF